MQSRNTDTEVICPTKTVVIKKTSSSSSGIVTAQRSVAAEQEKVPVTSLQLEGIAFQAYALLEDLCSQIFEMKVDLCV